MKVLTTFQRLMIDFIRNSGAVAVLVAGQWVGVEDVKRDAQLAELCWAIVG